jgi:peptidoglycan/LPS O-acetylase OafA/YrhL
MTVETREPDLRPAAPGGSTGHVAVMDGLRGIAILLVVLFHYWQLSFWAIPIPGPGDRTLESVQYAGFLGVELFFFLSAFCLFYPHAKAMVGLGPVPGLRHFAYRRAIKIVPSYWLALFALGVFFADLYPSNYQHGKLADLGLHLVFLHNLDEWTQGSFDGVLWSLGVEVQFYVLFPVLAWLFRRSPWLTAAGMVAVALGYRQWERQQELADLPFHEHQLPAFFDLFALGMLSAFLLVWIRQREAVALRLRYAFTAVAVTATVLTLVMFDRLHAVRYDAPAAVWQSHNRIWVGLLFATVAVASVFATSAWRRVLTNRALLFLSAISYNLYIWHQAVGVLIRKRGWWEADTPTPTDDPHWRWTFTFVGVGASVLVATVVTYAFERPLLRYGVRGCARKVWARVGQKAQTPPV